MLAPDSPPVAFDVTQTSDGIGHIGARRVMGRQKKCDWQSLRTRWRHHHRPLHDAFQIHKVSICSEREFWEKLFFAKMVRVDITASFIKEKRPKR